ncbi:hypothetical protein DPV78_000563 [Talaromyces pinophilus]|nr:hypothetical protein DPV78_000563 [Talaromyces pinophilus]
MDAGQGMTAIIVLFLGAYSFPWTPSTFVYPVEILNYTQRANGTSVAKEEDTIEELHCTTST